MSIQESERHDVNQNAMMAMMGMTHDEKIMSPLSRGSICLHTYVEINSHTKLFRVE